MSACFFQEFLNLTLREVVVHWLRFWITAWRAASSNPRITKMPPLGFRGMLLSLSCSVALQSVSCFRLRPSIYFFLSSDQFQNRHSIFFKYTYLPKKCQKRHLTLHTVEQCVLNW